MPPPLLHLALLAPLLGSAGPQGGNEVWRERRDEWMALDPLTADPDWLESALAEVASGGPSDDPDACVWAARAAQALYARLRQQGDPARGRAAIDLALPMCPDPGSAQPNLWIIASSHASLIADYPASVALAERAEESLSESQRASSLPVFIWALRGQALIQMGVPDQAAPWVERAVEHARSLRGSEDFESALIEAYLKRANLRMATDRYERMVTELEDVLADHELLADNSLARARFLLRLGIAHLWSVRGDDEAAAQARARFAEALAEPGIQAQDRLTVHMRLGQLELMVGEVEAARAPLERARALATQMGGGGAILSMDEALLCALEARVVRLDPAAAADARDAARRRLRDAFDAQLANWRTRPESRTGIGFLRYPAYQDVVAEVVEGELAVAPGEAGRRAALAQLARARSVGDLAEALGAREPDWDAIASLVPEGGGLLVWMGAPGASHAFAVDAAGTAHARLADLSAVQPPRDALER
ncbi:MAG TPA: hypothetical protein VMT18_09085, partial [Planctomycetota bacterium]|nr:hypothetical protein [Planctomycetota bacterium]